MKRQNFKEYLKEQEVTEVSFLQGLKRAYCFVKDKLFVVGEHTDITKEMYIVEGQNGGLFLSNKEEAAPIQVIGKLTI